MNIVKVDSGTQLSTLITDTLNHYLSGLEEFAYIPSTLGGAIAGNIHGVNQNNFDKFLETIDIYDLKEGKTRQLNAKELRWAYDTSEFQSHPEWVILSASLNLFPGNNTESKKFIADIILKKSQTQSLNSLGCVFKNPPGDSAGRLIDQELHLKSFRLGDVQISPLHANFFLNLGQASADDYYTLIKKVQQAAKDQLHLDLETEIKFLGNFNSRPLPSV